MKGSGGSHYRKERFYLNSRYYFRWEMIKIIRLEILIVLYIAKINGNNLYFCCRTSHEVRGLKCITTVSVACGAASHLTRGAWIEITMSRTALSSASGRTSHEVRGLKYYCQYGVNPP